MKNSVRYCFLALIGGMLASCISSPTKADVDSSDSLTFESVVDSLVEKMSMEPVPQVEDADECDWADTIGVVEGVTYLCVYHDYIGDEKEIVAMRDGDTLRRCRVYGPCCMPELKRGHNLWLYYGLEGKTLDDRRLPTSVNMNVWIVEKGFRHYERKRDYVISRASIRMSLPEQEQAWMAPLLADFMKAEDCCQYDEAQLAQRPRQPKVTTFSRLMNYYLDLKIGSTAPQFEPEDVGVVPDTDSRGIVPTWISPDSTLVTYRVDDYAYYGGAHPYYQVFYLTFDNERHQLLGMKDIFREGCTDEVIRRLKAKAGNWSIYCNEEIEEFALKNMEPRQERYRSHVIPRPALTKSGVVFSYQPYEIGCYADGDIHFVLPYAEIKDLLNPGIINTLKQ